MRKHGKQVIHSNRFKRDTDDLLSLMARRYEGNRSMVIRRSIRIAHLAMTVGALVADTGAGQN